MSSLQSQSSKSVSGCPAIDRLIEFAKTGDDEITWIPDSELLGIKPIQVATGQPFHYRFAKRSQTRPDGRLVRKTIVMLLLGTNDKCTSEHVNEFARIYSLPTHEYKNPPNVKHFQRYPHWLVLRNKLVNGFTKYESNYYLIADRIFHHSHFLHGFCSSCGILRCSPVWCICGHKELSNDWTSDNKSLDAFIKKTQMQTKSGNEAYLEWLPSGPLEFDDIEYIASLGQRHGFLHRQHAIEMIPLEISDKTDDSYYHKLCNAHPDILDTKVWMSVGFSYNLLFRKYELIKDGSTLGQKTYNDGLCLACTECLDSRISAFCFKCKAPRPLDWTTGNKSLDTLLMESWKNTDAIFDSHLQWVEYSQLINVQETPSLEHGCTRTANWLRRTASKNELIKVMLKKVVDGQNARLFDFCQLTESYPEITTPQNIWIIGITRELSTGDYYLMFYDDIISALNRFMEIESLNDFNKMKFIDYNNFYEIEEIGSGGYGTVYTARCKTDVYLSKKDQRVALKRFKNFNQTISPFISELRNHIRCSKPGSLSVYGVTRRPDTEEYMIVLQYASDGDLQSYLHENINRLTWKMKLECVKGIVDRLIAIHDTGLVHCDLHGGNIVLDKMLKLEYDFLSKQFVRGLSKPFICDFGLSQSETSSKPDPSNVQGVLPYIAPEIFQTSKFTQKSDIYALGILMYQIASGELPFRDLPFDKTLVMRICGGLRPELPGSTPEPYKRLAEKCCDADPNERPDARKLYSLIVDQIREADRDKSQNNVWNTIYYNDKIKPLSRAEKESKFSSKILPTANSILATQDFGTTY